RFERRGRRTLQLGEERNPRVPLQRRNSSDLFLRRPDRRGEVRGEDVSGSYENQPDLRPHAWTDAEKTGSLRASCEGGRSRVRAGEGQRSGAERGSLPVKAGERCVASLRAGEIPPGDENRHLPCPQVGRTQNREPAGLASGFAQQGLPGSGG